MVFRFRSADRTRPCPGNEKPLYAPDVVEKDGTYYLFFCLSDGYEGVAVSDRPEGPFTDPVQLCYPPDVNGGKPLCHIDPAVFAMTMGRYICIGDRSMPRRRG